ncbi:MAG: GAF domain-containing protein, partial [Rhodococcus sp. (in: high G+C Gram-positive bacteria)]
MTVASTVLASPGDSGLVLSNEAMHRLLRAVRDLAACRDVASVVEVVRHAARELVDADGATFVLRDNNQCYYVDEDAIEPLWRGQRFPLEACISGWSMLNEQQVVIPDIYLDERIPHAAYRPTFVQSLVMTPIRSGGGIGSIGTYWAAFHRATAEEQNLLQALADSTAVAMENARTLEALERTVAERTEELTASNRDLTAFAHVAAHDLKEPLTTIIGHT